jgi:hypothetical protein
VYLSSLILFVLTVSPLTSTLFHDVYILGLLGGSGFAALVDGIGGYTPNLGPLQAR